MTSVVALLLSACLQEEYVAPADDGLQVGDALPPFKVTLDDGRQVTHRTFLGDTLVLVFFSVKCGDCLRELPRVEAYYASLPPNSRQHVIGISRGEDATLVAPFWEQLSLTFPYAAEPTARVYHLFADYGVPRVYVAGPDGVVMKMY